MASVQENMADLPMMMSWGAYEEANIKPKWNLAFQSNIPVNHVSLVKWIIIVAEEYAEAIDNYIRNMMKGSESSRYLMLAFQIVKLNENLILPYLQKNDNVLQDGKDFQMLFVILPNNRADIYFPVMQILTSVDFPSTCLSAYEATSKSLLSIATETMMQMCNRLGREVTPWCNDMHLQNLMVIGFDVYTTDSAISIGGMVSTISGYKYFSISSTHQSEEELSNNFNVNIKKCCNAYKLQRGYLPETIIIFRSGFEGHQLKYIKMSELPQMMGVLQEVYGAKGKQIPKLSYIVVTKEINSSMLSEVEYTTSNNPLPASVIHGEIKLPLRYHFFLVSQKARRVIKPTSFFVLYDTQDITPDQNQLMIYKMCRISFDWPAISIVPVPSLFAYKLAFVTGISGGKQAHHDATHNVTFL